MGCILAVRLAEAGHTVSLLDKDAARASRLARAGITLQGRDRVCTVRLPVCADPASVPDCDLFCLCVKAFDTRAALHFWLPVIRRCSSVISFQNGLGNAEACAAAAGAERVFCAVTACGATRLAEGVVREAGWGPIVLAPWRAEASRDAEHFAQAVRSAGFEVQLHDNAVEILWSKLLVNAAINPVTALWDVPNGALIERADLHRIAAGTALEAQAVAAAAGVKLLFADAVQDMERVCRLTADNVSSMLQDVRGGRRTEIDAITGAVVEEARRWHVEVPINEDLLRRVRALETSRTHPATRRA